MILFGVHSWPDALAVKLHRRLRDTFSLWLNESKWQEVQNEENFTHLCYDRGCRRWSAEAAPRSGSSDPWSQFGFRAAEGEWASTEAWPGSWRLSRQFPVRLLEFPLGPSCLTAPRLKQGSGAGPDQRAGLLPGGPPPVVDAVCPTGPGLPPSRPDRHSVGPTPKKNKKT